MKGALSIKETAQHLGLTTRTIRRLIHHGGLPAVVISPRCVIIPIVELDMWLSQRSHEQPVQNPANI